MAGSTSRFSRLGGFRRGLLLAVAASAVAATMAPALAVAAGSAGPSVVVRASGSEFKGWPAFHVHVNGVRVTSKAISVTSSAPADYSVPVASLPDGANVDIVFINRTGSPGVATEGRTLFIDHVAINGAVIASNAAGVTFDRGGGAAAFDGSQVIPGQRDLSWNGALRLTAPNSVVGAPVTPPPVPPAVPPVATLALSPATVAENGTANLTFTVSLDRTAIAATTIRFTLAGTASAGVDFAAPVDQVVIPAGGVQATVVVDPTPDIAVERDETVTLTLVGGTGYTLGAVVAATGTIGNDDTPNPGALFASPTYRAALAAWRAPREKGACMSCHGPDFVDLAATGSTDADMVRRAVIDGASQLEANRLVVAMREMRDAFAIEPVDPRSFRLLQPGGEVLPGATPIERDVALGEQLLTVLPALTGSARIGSLAAAQRARDEVLAVDFDRVRIGVPFPLWSADRAHAREEGVLNDWISDLAQLPKPEREAAWIALQDAYLADPSDVNFWRMYFAVGAMTETFPTHPTVEPADRTRAEELASLKYRSTLIGQHVLRSQALGRDDFMRGPVAFAHVAAEEPFKTLFARESAFGTNGERLPAYLPNPMWEFGDTARSALTPSTGPSGRKDATLLADQLRQLGYPAFVVDSVDPTLTLNRAEHDLRLAWFMIGQRFDPGMQRMSQSNSTRAGEYLQANLWDDNYFIHRQFVEAMRSVFRAFDADSFHRTQPGYNLHFGYFNRYNRDRPTRWNGNANVGLPASVTTRQIELLKQFTANFYRMSLYLHEEALDTGKIAPYGVIDQDGQYAIVKQFFDYAGLPGLAEDIALIRRVAAKSKTPLNF